MGLQRGLGVFISRLKSGNWRNIVTRTGRGGRDMLDDRNSDAAGYIGWFFLGAVAGAAAALLMAPKSGRETRDLLAEHGEEVLNKARGAAGEAKVKAGDLFEKGRDDFEEQTNRLITAFEAGKSAMREEIRQGRPDV